MPYRIVVQNGVHEGATDIPPVEDVDIASWMVLPNPSASILSEGTVEEIAGLEINGKQLFNLCHLKKDVAKASKGRTHCAYQLVKIDSNDQTVHYKFYGEVGADWQPQDVPPNDDGFLINW